MIFLSKREKEKTCAYIQFQINLLSKRIDEIDGLNRPITDEEYDEQTHCQEAISFYNNIIQKIKQD